MVVKQKMSGIAYTDFRDTTSNMWRTVIPSLDAGAVVIGLVALWLGWWGAALRDKHCTRLRWALIAPVVVMVLHGLWDTSIFVQGNSGAATSPLTYLTYVAAPIALVSGFVVARRTQRETVEDYAVGADHPVAVPA